MSAKKKDNDTDLNQNKYIAEKEYQYAISLMQYATTLLWQQFSVFMLVETLIIGYVGNALIDQNSQLVLDQSLFVFVGSILGLLICVLWYSTFEHNYKSYLLRMKQARRHERVFGISLFTEGEKEYVSGRIPRLLRPRGALILLIILFSILFTVLIFVTVPYR